LRRASKLGRKHRIAFVEGDGYETQDWLD
jgi:hypothetical protein